MTKPPRGRRPVARHGRLSSPHPIAQFFKVLAVGLAVVLVSGAGVAAYAGYDLGSDFAENAVELPDAPALPPDVGAIEGGVNLLIVGTDECEPELIAVIGDRCTGADAGGQLNDVNILVNISEEPRRVTAISFPRDLLIPIPSCTDPETGEESWEQDRAQINTAYSYGGLGCVVSTISQLTGINIQFAAKVSFGGVVNITNAIGGVDVCLAQPIRDRYTNLDWEAGPRTIEGVDALQFLRTRHGVGDGSDLGRISNQQSYLSSLARKLISGEVLSNPALLYNLASTAVNNVVPTTSLTNPMTLVQIAMAVKDVPFNEIVFVQYPTNYDTYDVGRVVPNEEAAETLLAAIAANVPLQLSGEASQGMGVVVQGEGEGETDPAAEAPVDETAAPPGTIVLPEDIAGTTAAQVTCSNGTG